MILAVSGPVWGLLAVIYFVLLVVLGEAERALNRPAAE